MPPFSFRTSSTRVSTPVSHIPQLLPVTLLNARQSHGFSARLYELQKQDNAAADDIRH